jgi:hypothetical protein
LLILAGIRIGQVDAGRFEEIVGARIGLAEPRRRLG